MSEVEDDWVVGSVDDDEFDPDDDDLEDDEDSWGSDEDEGDD